MHNLIKFIFLILFFFSGYSSAEDNITVISKSLKKGDTFYKVFSKVEINNQDSELFISSLKRRLDLTKNADRARDKILF